MSKFISLATAVEMTSRYRQYKNKVISPDYQDMEVLCLSEKFDRGIFDTLLAKPGCAGIRIYYGMDAGFQVHALVVAFNENDEDILAVQGSVSSLDAGDDVGNDALRCPPWCPPPSPLNN